MAEAATRRRVKHPNPVRAQDDANWQANWRWRECANCYHGGGTMQRAPQPEGLQLPNATSVRLMRHDGTTIAKAVVEELWMHTEHRFCETVHDALPKHQLAAIIRRFRKHMAPKLRQEEARAKQRQERQAAGEQPVGSAGEVGGAGAPEPAQCEPAQERRPDRQEAPSGAAPGGPAEE